MFNRRRYERERGFEQKSQIRLRGKLWYQVFIFFLYVAVGLLLALLVGTFARVLWYVLANGLGNLIFNPLGYYIDPAFSLDYLKRYFMFSISGGTFQDRSWITWILMGITFLLILRLAFKNSYDWLQKFSDRTTNQNRWAELKEIDAVYKLIPDRNKYYKGQAGEPIVHISGYSLQFLSIHPLLWVIQFLKLPFGLNMQIFPLYYRFIRKILLKTPIGSKLFQGQENVKGGFSGFYWIDTTPTHTSITAPTRIGKDQRIGYPTIDVIRRAEIQPNIIDTDAKNEDGKMAFIPLLEAGYDVSFINIMDPYWSELWNPLQVALNYAIDGEMDKAIDESNVIVQIIGSAGNTDQFGGDDQWDKSAEDTQLAIILVLLWLAIDHNDPTFATPASVPQFINSLGQFSDPKDKNKDGLSEYFKMLSQLDPKPPIIDQAILKAASYLQSTGDTRTSVMFTLQRHSSLFASQTVAKLTSRSTIQISDYGFPRMLKIMLPVAYAGLTAYVELYDLLSDDPKKFVEQDSMKVSSTGVIHYPFKKYFSEQWEIRVHFKSNDNPHHLRNDWVRLQGEKRQKHSIGGKPLFDKYSGKPVLKIVPGALKFELFENGRAKYDLRYSEKPKATFIVAPQNNDNYSALASLFIGQVFSVNTEIASQITRRKMDRWIIFKLNEFSMWPKIPGFSNFLTRGLTYGHIVNLYLQDDVQISKHYSDIESKEIKSNMLTQYYLQTKDSGTKEEVSKRLGNIEVQKELVNSQMGEQQQDRGNRVVSIDSVPLMPEKNIEEMLEGEAIVFRTAKRSNRHWKPVRALPIFDTEGTAMPNSRDLIGKSYRLDYFTTKLPIKNHIKNFTYDDLFQDFSRYFYELQERLSLNARVGDDLGTMLKDATDLKAVIDEAYGRDHVQLSEKQVSDEDYRTKWREQFTANLDEPFIPEDQMSNLSVVMEIEELINGILSTKHYLSRTVPQTNALQLSERGELFATMPQLNTNRKLLDLLDRNMDSMFELQKRLDGRTHTPSASQDADDEAEDSENAEVSKDTDTTGMSDDELRRLEEAQGLYDEEN
ncbi:type IV secretion system protein VirD4 [Weissella muntiaci]|uniref:Type IV secretion system protein VirD4 n=1 Tax=Weissella muntiaci TaxID=2508881 RepID=A0A6C2CBS6_9LACO|nr:type IV secretory system conjugative DNA transfer family protein [Weissella muntiaci]TYC51062.1 type IV secretion system protein VirD4 [Weissella muntiaci]